MIRASMRVGRPDASALPTCSRSSASNSASPRPPLSGGKRDEVDAGDIQSRRVQGVELGSETT